VSFFLVESVVGTVGDQIALIGVRMVDDLSCGRLDGLLGTKGRVEE